ncbi:MAG: hypothetical protein QOH67_405 [Hyphomicrobiales bacterium]|jgi:plastocyanin|nr:hypothetical protein [Hyphomicrobiales bacterium]
MAQTYNIDIDERDDEMGFFPAEQSIAVGDTVVWTNRMGFAHTASALGGAFDSKNIEAGKTFSHTFTAAGNVPYRCNIHTDMKGVIKVA